MQVHQASGIYAFVGLLAVFIVGVPVLIYSFSNARNILHTGAKSYHSFFNTGCCIHLDLSFLPAERKIISMGTKNSQSLFLQLMRLFSANISTRHFASTVLFSLGVECCGILHFIYCNKSPRITGIIGSKRHCIYCIGAINDHITIPQGAWLP